MDRIEGCDKKEEPAPGTLDYPCRLTTNSLPNTVGCDGRKKGDFFSVFFFVRPIGPLSYFPLKLCREVRRKDILQKRNWDRIMS